MSAYIVDRDHIAYLVHAAQRLARGSSFHWYHNDTPRELRAGDHELGTEVGNMLWRENVRSVSGRYPNENADVMPDKRTLPGPTDDVLLYLHAESPWLHFDPVQVLKSISCYSYQSCEHKEWEASEAHAFCSALEREAIGALRGYEAAEWGAPARPSGPVPVNIMSLVPKRKR